MLRYLCLVALLSILFVPLCHSAPLTYQFTVTALTGPLAGQTSQGSFSFDSSVIIPGSTVQQSGLLTTLDFTWDSIHYDETSADTGFLKFHNDGTLASALFGSNCVLGSCSVSANALGQWIIIKSTNPIYSPPPVFYYGTPQGVYDGFVDYLVPEPASLHTMAVGLVVLALASIRIRRN